MKKIKIGTVTFHKAENYGSALQTYALQEFTKALVTDGLVDYTVINLRPKSQGDLYSLYQKGLSFSKLIKNAVAYFYRKDLSNRKDKFDDFLNSEICLTPKFDDIASAEQYLSSYDYLISGSDQIWNVRTKDFADFYYLNFNNKAKRISYAASFGPLKIDWQKYDAAKYTTLLRKYKHISVREEGSAVNVKGLTEMDCEIHVDPTLLLNVEEWRKVQSDANYQGGKYILLYCLEPSKQQLKLAKAISKHLNLPILTLRYNNKNDIFNNFVKRYDAGPRDFLAYIDHAALVITSSFHGTAFSIIYRKPFYVLNGMSDNRISNILSQTGLEHHAIDESFNPEEAKILIPDIESINQYLATERERSRNYLKKALLL